jgi:hypothetical protein
VSSNLTTPTSLRSKRSGDRKLPRRSLIRVPRGLRRRTCRARSSTTAWHPQDAARIYQTLVDPLIRHKNNKSYQEAVGFMHKVHGLMVKLGQEREFVAWMQAIKTEHKRKRNLIKYVERRAWGK